MGDRGATPPIGGVLDGFVGPVVPLQVAYFDSANQLTAVSFRLLNPASGGTIVVQLNTESDGSGDGIEVIIPDGERWGRATGAVDIPAGGSLDLSPRAWHLRRQHRAHADYQHLSQ